MIWNKVGFYLFTRSIIEAKLESLGLLDLVVWKERERGSIKRA
jgi:hypothetical protein